MAIIKAGLYKFFDTLTLTETFSVDLPFVLSTTISGTEVTYTCNKLSCKEDSSDFGLYCNIIAVEPAEAVDSSLTLPSDECFYYGSENSFVLAELQNLRVTQDTAVTDSFAQWFSENTEAKSCIKKGTYKFNDTIEQPPIATMSADFTLPVLVLEDATVRMFGESLVLVNSDSDTWGLGYTGLAVDVSDSSASEEYGILAYQNGDVGWTALYTETSGQIPSGYGQIITLEEDVYVTEGYENCVEWFNENASEYTEQATWTSQALRTIKITGGTDAESSDLQSFLTINAEEASEQITVIWKNYNGDILQENLINIGDTPTYTGPTPTKEGTPHYTYTFAGWNPEVGSVTTSTVYVAQFTATVNKYTIKWLNDDGSELYSEQVEYGVVPTYGMTPTKATTDAEIFTFAGWSPTVVAVTQDATYTATYTSEPRYYTVLWQNEDYSTLLSQQVAYGVTPSYPNDNPTKADTEDSYFTFNGWSPAISPVVSDVVYTATFTEHVLTTYQIHLQLIYLDADASSATEIKEGRTAIVKLIPKDGFTLPSDIIVTGAEYSYDIITGEVLLSNPIMDITIEARAVRVIDSNILIGKLGKIGAAFFNGKKVESIWLGNIQIYGVSDAIVGSVITEANDAGGLTYIIVSDNYTVSPNDAGGNTYDITVDGYKASGDAYYSEEANALGTTVIFDTYEEEANDLGTTVIIHTTGSGEYYAEEANALGTTVIFGNFSSEENAAGTTVNINH